MLRISQAGDYAVRGVLHMVTKPQGTIFLVRKVAEDCGIPRPFLAKIFQTLARAGVLRSHQGSGGGFSLARPATHISLLDVVEAVEGKILLHECVDKVEQGLCETPQDVAIGEAWSTVQQGMIEVLSNATMAALAERVAEIGPMS